MEKIYLTFLGTGNAIPTKFRNHSAILISYANENLLFDCGEGTQRQFKIIGISPTKITRIFISHWHGDHILGLPGLFQTLAMSNYQKTLKIYGPKGTKRFLSLIQELILDFHINLEIREIEQETLLDEKNFQIHAMPMSHGISSLAYSFILKDKIRLNKKKLKQLKLPNSPILKQLQQGKDIIINGKKIKASQVCYKENGKKITIILDTSLNQNCFSIAKNSDILITEASFTSKEKKQAEEYKHLLAKEAAQIAKKSKSKKLLLTHLSQRYERNPKQILDEAKKIFKNSFIVKDFDKIVL
ncbi:MAG: ribonuclease Z [Candidatus Pacearchaeota archaeon]|nr:ribonuclease Z [Candidatus Pacearchaeota archaeon]